MLIVVAGLIYCRDKVLIAQRELNDSGGGKWEFPGGKVEYGETPEQAIARELKEELDMSPEIDAVCDAQISWNAAGGITLLLCRGHASSERLTVVECHAARFVYPRELIKYDLLPMDREFAKRQGLIK